MKNKNVYITTGAVYSEVSSVKRYMSDIKKAPLLSKGEEQELGSKIRSGDKKAINELVKSNLRFVVQVAKQYQGMGIELEDLIASGNIGLFEAVKKYDPLRGVRFISFAIWYIRAELQKALNNLSRVVRIPSHKTMTEGKEFSTISTSTPIGEDEDSDTYADRYLPAPIDTPESTLNDLKYDLNRALNNLKEKQKLALTMFYGIGYEYPKSMESISRDLSISDERVRQLIRAAEDTLRSMSGIKLLEQYL